MSTSVPQPTYQWRVTDTRADSEIGPGGLVVQGLRIDFTVADPAVSGSVFVPNSRKGEVEYVKSLIMAEAGQLAALATLSSD